MEEPVEVGTDGLHLADVRKGIKEAEHELADLRKVPTPSSDIEQRIRNYVTEMARPSIGGVGSGETLTIVWPGSGWNQSGPRQYSADVLSMTALLHPDQMVDALMQEVDRMVNDPLPLAQREQRIGELERELETLQRQDHGDEHATTRKLD